VKIPFKSIVIFSVLSFVIGLSVGMFASYPLHFQAYLRENYGVGSISELNKILSPQLQFREAYSYKEIALFSSQSILVVLLISTRFWKNDKCKLSRKILFIVVFSAFIIGSFSGDKVSLVSAQTATYVVNPEGAFVKTVAYIIYPSGSIYYAVNGQTGTSIHNSNAYIVISSSVNATDRGTIFLKSGIYEITHDVWLKNYTRFRGEGIDKTIIKQADGANLEKILWAGTNSVNAYGVEIRDLTVDFNYGGQTVTYNAIDSPPNPPASYWGFGIKLIGEDHTVENVKLINAATVALSAGGDANYGTVIRRLYIRNLKIISDWPAGSLGVLLTGYTGSDLRDQIIIDGLFIDNGVAVGESRGVQLEERCRVNIGNFYIISKLGFRFTGSSPNYPDQKIQVHDGLIEASYAGMYIYNVQNLNVENVIITGDMVHGIEQNSYFGDAGKLTFRNIEISGSLTGQPILISSTTVPPTYDNIQVRNGTSYIYYENDGTVTFNGDGVTTTFYIPHGLADTPTSYYVQKAVNGLPNIDYVEADETNLIVHFASAPPSGTNNVVLEWRAKV